MFNKLFSKKFSQGNVLLSTILIMGLSLNIGLVIAVLALSGFSRSNTIKSQALSYYAAESGIEASLYKVRRGGVEVEKLSANPVGVCSNDYDIQCSDDSECGGGNNKCLYNTIVEKGTSWQTKGQITASAIQEDLEQDKSLVLYLYNPDTWESGLTFLQITWYDTCQNNSVLDVEEIYPITNQTQLDNLNWNNPDVASRIKRNSSDVMLNNGTTLFLSPVFAYAIKITAGDCYVNFLEITGKDAGGNVVDLNVESVITATGSVGNVKQTIRVSM